MTDDERRAALDAAVRRGTRPGGLAKACLLVARGAHPRLDPTVALAELRRLGELCRAAAAAADGTHPAEVLAAVLGGAEGFGGSGVDYDDPEMSYLHRVIARRRGLPILLSVVWIEAARAAGMPVRPLPFPGHFAVMVAGVIVDPSAGGRRLSSDETMELFRSRGGRSRPLGRDSTTRRIVLRILGNLAGAYERRGEFRRLETVLGDAIALEPDDPFPFLRRGEARARFDDRLGALDDLNRALSMLPSGAAFERAHAVAAALVRSGISVN